MKPSLKALLLSALVFPGAGYFSLNKAKQGWAFLMINLSSLAVLMYDAMQKAQIISEKIAYGHIPLDISHIRQQIEDLPDVVDGNIIAAAYLIILLLWLGGMIDSYRIGKIQEN
ncbi:MAG: hypothetical protein RPT11_03570, partial [Bermanella sp.]